MASFDIEWDIRYKDTDDPDKVRTVGVEFECTITNPACPSPEPYDEDYDSYEAFYDINSDFDSYTETKYGFKVAGAGKDGSEYEFVSNPDSIKFYNEGGSERFKALMKFLKENGEPTRFDGTHIHISKLDTDNNAIYQHMKWITANFGTQIQKIFGRVSSWALTPAQEVYNQLYARSSESELIKILLPKDYKKIVDISVSNKGGIVINRSQTYEFRGGKGSNDINEVLAWIQLVRNITELANKSIDTINKTQFKQLIKGKYINKYMKKLQNNPMRAFSKEEIEQTINSNKLIQTTNIPPSEKGIL